MGPLPGVRERPSPEPGKQAELQMVVSIDQARKQQATAEWNRQTALTAWSTRELVQSRNPSLADREIEVLGLLRAERYPGPMQEPTVSAGADSRRHLLNPDSMISLGQRPEAE